MWQLWPFFSVDFEKQEFMIESKPPAQQSFTSILNYLILRGGGHPENASREYWKITCKRTLRLIDSSISTYLVLGL